MQRQAGCLGGEGAAAQRLERGFSPLATDIEQPTEWARVWQDRRVRDRALPLGSSRRGGTEGYLRVRVEIGNCKTPGLEQGGLLGQPCELAFQLDLLCDV